MTTAWTLDAASLDDVRRLAELIALKVRPGDVIALRGDLGAGKTTFARALIRCLLGDETAEVPSPTFPLVQTYDTTRLALSHFDLYRLQGEDDLAEIGFDDAATRGLAIVEWPDRAEGRLGPERLELELSTGATAETRHVALTAFGGWRPRLERLRLIDGFLRTAAPADVALRITYLQGDASTRAYARIAAGDARYVLMDAPRMPDGPPVRGGLPYSRIAHLAEDVGPFVAVGRALEACGLSVPHIAALDAASGLLLLEDLGDLSFGRALREGYDQRELWLAAVDTLVALKRSPPHGLKLPDGSSYALPRFDRAALEIELDLLLDWYWPAMMGEAAPDGLRGEFRALWAPVLDRMLAEPAGFFLRDFHSPNIFWLPERRGVQRVGVIDFQDALAEPWAYDLASLLQDARVDVSEALESEGFNRYCAAAAATDPAFDRDAFARTYAAFGAQRNTRLVGLWVRLLKRDGKPGYLQHMPRTWDYLARNLAHPDLAPLRVWYDRHFPEAVRNRLPTA